MTGGILTATKRYLRPCVFLPRRITIPLHVIVLGCRMHPGGRIHLLEYHAEDPRGPIKPLHKMTAALDFPDD